MQQKDVILHIKLDNIQEISLDLKEWGTPTFEKGWMTIKRIEKPCQTDNDGKS